MKRLLFLLALLVCGLSFTMFMGCSDDDDNSNPIVEGDQNSEEFQFYGDMVGEPAMEISKYPLFTTLALLDSFVIPEETAKNGPLFATAEGDPLIVFDSVTISVSDNWIIFYFEFTEIDTDGDYSETLFVYGTDSVKVYENDMAVLEPDGIPDSVDAREHFHIEYTDTDDLEVNASGHHSLKIGGDLPDSTVLNSYSLDSMMSYFVPEDPGFTLCSLRVVSASDIDNLTLPLDSVDEESDVCPLAGRIDFTSTINLGCAGDSAVFNVNGEWLLTVVFSDGNESYTVTYGNTVWHWEKPCE